MLFTTLNVALDKSGLKADETESSESEVMIVTNLYCESALMISPTLTSLVNKDPLPKTEVPVLEIVPVTFFDKPLTSRVAPRR